MDSRSVWFHQKTAALSWLVCAWSKLLCSNLDCWILRFQAPFRPLLPLTLKTEKRQWYCEVLDSVTPRVLMQWLLWFLEVIKTNEHLNYSMLFNLLFLMLHCVCPSSSYMKHRLAIISELILCTVLPNVWRRTTVGDCTVVKDGVSWRDHGLIIEWDTKMHLGLPGILSSTRQGFTLFCWQ